MVPYILATFFTAIGSLKSAISSETISKKYGKTLSWIIFAPSPEITVRKPDVHYSLLATGVVLPSVIFFIRTSMCRIRGATTKRILLNPPSKKIENLVDLDKSR